MSNAPYLLHGPVIGEADHRRWPERFPVWVCGADDVPWGHHVVPAHWPSVAMARSDAGLVLTSNVCTHKGALMRQGRGRSGSLITCPVHRWCWEHGGRLRAARGFERDPSMDLARVAWHQWQGHLFMGQPGWQADIDRLPGNARDLLDMGRYRWVSGDVLSYAFSWRVFMEIYLDLYHVAPAHPGLGSLADPRGFAYVEGSEWSCQTARYNAATARSEPYGHLQELYKRLGLHDAESHGSIWLGIYPNTMIEHYPGTLVVSTVWPAGPGRCTNNLEFYHEPRVLDACPEFPEVFQRAFMQTADEDEQIGLRFQAGRSSLVRPVMAWNHDPEESGIAHFHRWMDLRMPGWQADGS